MEKHHILAPIDFSEHSKATILEAASLAKLISARITLLYVNESSSFNSGIFDMMGKGARKTEEKEKEIHKHLDVQVKIAAEESGQEVVKAIAHGKIYKEILQYSQKAGVTLIVMGTHGQSGFEQRILGTNASRVSAMSAVPVITIKERTSRRGVKNILLPLDLTKETRQKVNECIKWAQLFKAEVHVTSIWATSDASIKRLLESQINQVVEFLKKKGVEYSWSLHKADDIAEGILQVAKAKKSDMIVIMSQSETGIKDFLLGSTAERIIMNSPIPVLSLRPKKLGETLFSPY